MALSRKTSILFIALAIILILAIGYVLFTKWPVRKVFVLPNKLSAYLPAFQSKNDTLLNYSGFMVSLNKKNKLASLVLYKLRKVDLQNKRAKRKNNFRADPGLRDLVNEPKQYSRSGYDRGHLAPCEDLMSSQEKVDQSFYMSNIAPQIPGFNRGMWKKLENRVRQYAMENDSVIVITGPFRPRFDPRKPGLAVPEYYYKVVLDISPPEYKAIAFLMKNDRLSGEVTEYAISIDSLEATLGYDFFNQLDSTLQEMIEEQVDGRKW
ncbi:MAG: DNA/RNA non-specific endonuclease [Bacteroides sp.]|jgi:endonuclease G|nr:DNA/RNA non-specific endonuclease [Bacteroides sp.]